MSETKQRTAVILAGGKGTRLYPYTAVFPKPLMPIGDFPILEIVIRQLSSAGFGRIILAVNHQAEIIKAYFENGERWGVSIEYSLEKIPLSTMGPLKLIDNLPDDFLVMNGDIVTDLDYRMFYENHVSTGNLFTISSYRREIRSEYGVLEINGDKLVGFNEKPILSFDVSMGIYMVNNRILDLIPAGQTYGFDNLMHDLIKQNTPASIVPFSGYWLDIGRPEDYVQAVEEFDSMKERLLR